MHEKLKYTQHGKVVVLTLNDPATRNAINGEEMFAAFEDAVSRINADRSLGAVILTGEGTSFCSGGNIREMQEKKGMFSGTAEEITSKYKAGVHRVPKALTSLELPLIAAVNGPAVGLGCDIACMCDIRIASEKAKFAASFIKLGLVAGDGGSWFLSQAVGYSQAAEMLFSGDTLDAETAYRIGLVRQVVPESKLLDEALSFANKIASNPPQTLRWAKKLLREAQESGLEKVMNTSAIYQGLAHQTADHQEALSAFLEKRVPSFEGR